MLGNIKNFNSSIVNSSMYVVDAVHYGHESIAITMMQFFQDMLLIGFSGMVQSILIIKFLRPTTLFKNTKES